jgi:hypothetical protein
MALAVGLAVAAGGCGYLTNPTAPTANSTLAHPILVWHGDRNEEEAFGNAIWAETAKCLEVDEELLTGVEVTIVDGPFMCGKVLAAGCTLTWPRRITVNRQYFRNALTHEFINMTWAATGHRFAIGPDGNPLDDWKGTPYGHCDPNALNSVTAIHFLY